MLSLVEIDTVAKRKFNLTLSKRRSKERRCLQFVAVFCGKQRFETHISDLYEHMSQFASRSILLQYLLASP